MTDSATGGFLAPITPLPAEDDALDKILQALVVGVTGLPGHLVRPRWQETPPTQPEAYTNWAAIGVVDEDPESNVSIVHHSDGEGWSTTIDHDMITVLASFYGPMARGNAKKLRTGLMLRQNRETLFYTGLALAEMPDKSRFVPDIVNQQTLRRVDISLIFRRRTVLDWGILNLKQMQGALTTDAGPRDPLLTPRSVDPLIP